jgi:hypothetical protein
MTMTHHVPELLTGFFTPKTMLHASDQVFPGLSLPATPTPAPTAMAAAGALSTAPSSMTIDPVDKRKKQRMYASSIVAPEASQSLGGAAAVLG